MESTEVFERPGVRGFLHLPSQSPPRSAMVLVHGAGGNCRAPLMVAVANAFAGAGYAVLRCDLAFRQERAQGPPRGSPKRDQESIRLAAAAVRDIAPACPVVVAGHSYGGRQATMVAAETPDLADGLLLLSYPLHAPGKVEPRTQHFPALRTPALFVHGTRDTFGTIEEVQAALAAIPVRHALQVVDGGVHGLPPALAPSIAEWFEGFRVGDH
ncbi:MAG TPA: alpha/beta fold hydrolase [Bryobacteraceae bacterium]|nr:alpha/beta fold hydrolase [Bryobacteraceae bacterium]